MFESVVYLTDGDGWQGAGSPAPVPATTIKPDLSLAMIHDLPNKTGGRTANESNNTIYSLLLYNIYIP